MFNSMKYLAVAIFTVGTLTLLSPPAAQANPAFARQYSLSCATCHAAFPRLNSFGEDFLARNIRLPDWKEKMGVDTGDNRLVLPKLPSVAFRVQSFVQARQADAVDASTGETTANGDLDFQSPYLIKLFSGAPVSDHMSYYFYAIMAEKGENATLLLEDAWISHDDLFASGVGMTMGQFQLSDSMFPRETRMTFQDFIPYRMADLTYQRGVMFDRELGPVDLVLGAVNGNGIEANQKVNSAGYQRPDRAFDSDTKKTVFGRVGTQFGPVKAGVFIADGHNAAVGNSRVIGLDLSTNNGRWFWFAQALQARWSKVMDPATPTVQVASDADWCAGFAGVDYVHNDRWSYSLLYNYGNAGDLFDTATTYRGIEMNNLTLSTSYYFMRNLKGVIEVNADFLAADKVRDGIGHDTREGYVLMGVDLAF